LVDADQSGYPTIALISQNQLGTPNLYCGSADVAGCTEDFRAEEWRSPSPVAGSSGLQPPTARSAKKRKRASTPPIGRGGGEEEVPDSEVRTTNAILKTEMANLFSRAVSLQTTL
jgi:hypothetical protein